MRSAAALALPLALLACQDGEIAPPEGYAEQDVIACRSGGAAQFAPDCGVERQMEGGTPVLLVRHPDGHFRRFAVKTDGTGLAAADGAEPVRQQVVDGMLEVSVGSDAYRFPLADGGYDGGQ